MKTSRFLQNPKIPQLDYLAYLGKWLLLSVIIGAIAGSVVAFFLVSLDWVTNWREQNRWVIALLPIGGLAVGLLYHYFGSDVAKGNNLILEEYHRPKKTIPLKMAPMVLFGTLVTHLFGGSAGREGTAVQIGGALADQLAKLLQLRTRERKIILILGISAGFSAVFGTPLAGAIFALEVLVIGRIRHDAILPGFLVAAIADYTCRLWGVSHTKYSIPEVPDIDFGNLLWTILAGIAFGLTALLFSRTLHLFAGAFAKYVKFPPIRPLVGGIIVALGVFMLGTTKYVGLGIPIILESFETSLPPCDFLFKILLTAVTLAAGFKGGEVTPLFFIGATLGSALAFAIPLPVALLAGMGFVAVFSGATNTPIACAVMGMELFGSQCGIFMAIACVVAYLFSGHTGIYASQVVGSPKHFIYRRLVGKQLDEL